MSFEITGRLQASPDSFWQRVLTWTFPPPDSYWQRVLTSLQNPGDGGKQEKESALAALAKYLKDSHKKRKLHQIPFNADCAIALHVDGAMFPNFDELRMKINGLPTFSNVMVHMYTSSKKYLPISDACEVIQKFETLEEKSPDIVIELFRHIRDVLTRHTQIQGTGEYLLLPVTPLDVLALIGVENITREYTTGYPAQMSSKIFPSAHASSHGIKIDPRQARLSMLEAAFSRWWQKDARTTFPSDDIIKFGEKMHETEDKATKQLYEKFAMAIYQKTKDNPKNRDPSFAERLKKTEELSEILDMYEKKW